MDETSVNDRIQPAAPLRRLSRASSEPVCSRLPDALSEFADRSERASPRTLCPALMSSATTAEPTKPVAPVTKTRMLRLLFLFTDSVKIREDFCGDTSLRSLKVLAKMLQRTFPGISRMFGERCRSQASASCMVVIPSEEAAVSSSDDCSGVKPPSGKNGT